MVRVSHEGCKFDILDNEFEENIAYAYCLAFSYLSVVVAAAPQRETTVRERKREREKKKESSAVVASHSFPRLTHPLSLSLFLSLPTMGKPRAPCSLVSTVSITKNNGN